MILLNTPSISQDGENFLLDAKGTIYLGDQQVAPPALWIVNFESFSDEELAEEVSFIVVPADQGLLKLSLSGHTVSARRLRFARTVDLVKLIADDINVVTLWPKMGWAWNSSAADPAGAMTKLGALSISTESRLLLPSGPRLRPSALAERAICLTA